MKPPSLEPEKPEPDAPPPEPVKLRSRLRLKIVPPGLSRAEILLMAAIVVVAAADIFVSFDSAIVADIVEWMMHGGTREGIQPGIDIITGRGSPR